MEKTVLYQFLIEVPRAAAIWSVLLVLALGVLTVLVARPEPSGPVEQPADPDAARAAIEQADLHRYAGEVAVAAAGAAQNADRRRTAWRVAQTELDRAWAGYDEAESAARRLAGVTGLPTPRTPDPGRVRGPGTLAAPSGDGRPLAWGSDRPAAQRRAGAPARLGSPASPGRAGSGPRPGGTRQPPGRLPVGGRAGA
ncbi:hypothetical protein GCM10029963_22250 [Micromonospora andamanensis]